MGVLAAFLILSYYSVVAGWTLEYVYEALRTALRVRLPQNSSLPSSSSPAVRGDRSVVGSVSVGYSFYYCQRRGEGIEKSSKIMMPTLFIIILILVICSVTLPGAGAGIEFLLKPDFSKVDGNVFLSAMGQAFFSLSLGMGCLCT